MGGAITQSLGWEWIFWINLPVLAIVLICVLVAMLAGGPDLRGQKYDLPFLEKVKSLDWLGTSLLILTLTPFILGIQLGQTDNWSGGRFPAMFAISGVSFILLIIQQMRAPEPIFDRNIMLNRSVWSTAGLFLSALSCVAVLILFLPFLLQVCLSSTMMRLNNSIIVLLTSLRKSMVFHRGPVDFSHSHWQARWLWAHSYSQLSLHLSPTSTLSGLWAVPCYW